MIVALRKGSVMALTIAACTSARAPQVDLEGDDLQGIEGANCAGAAPAMTAPDGQVYPFQSVVAYYYQVLAAYRTQVGPDDVIQTWLPPAIQATSEAFYAWQAKSIQIYQDPDLLGYSHRYYRGMFGYARPAGSRSGSGSGSGSGATCSNLLDSGTRQLGMLAHVALSQASECGQNDDGTTKFWQVKRISLLPIGGTYDANALVGAGLAAGVAGAVSDRCILPVAGAAPAGPGIPVPCQIAFRADAVTEAVVLPVPSSAVVAGVALGHRAFTAAGTVAMPNQLDDVRRILRDDELRAMFAIGLPMFSPAPWAGPTQVQLVGHRIGPAQAPSSVLLPDERAWIDGIAGSYAARCCTVSCKPPAGSGSGSGSGSGDPGCTTTCVAEGACATGSVSAGLAVMVSSVTTRDCLGSCPAPATGAPDVAPACAP